MMKEDLTLNHFFQKMVDDITRVTDQTEEIVKELAQKAMTAWEEREQMDLANVFSYGQKARNEEVKKVVELFEKSAKKLFPSQKELENSIELAQKNFTSMFSV